MTLLKLPYIKRFLAWTMALCFFCLALASPVLAIPTLSSTPAILAEGILNGARLDLVLPPADGEFSVATAPTLAFTLNNAPPGLIVSQATINTVTSATLELAFDGTVFSSDIDNFSVTIDESILSGIIDLTSNNASILSDHAPPEVIISAAGNIQESSLDNSHVFVALEHEEFTDGILNRSNFTLNNAPPGLIVGGVIYTSPTGATLVLDYDGTDFYADYTMFSVTVAGTELKSGASATSNQLTIYADTNSSNCYLASLAVNGSPVPDFTPGNTAYTHILPAGASSVPVVSAVAQDPNASLSITQASALSGSSGERTATVLVTAQDGSSQRSYTVTFSRTPQVLSTVPFNGESNVNENNIFKREINGQTYYFLEVVYNDPDGSLSRTASFLDLLRSSRVYAEGGSQSSIVNRDLISYIAALEDPDAFIDSYIFVAGAGTRTLYIPVRHLGAQVSYVVELNAGLVEYTDGADNPAYSWSFSTMALPSVSQVVLGSVPEDYDESEPIIMEGERFNDNVAVYFNDTPAYRVRVESRSDGSQYLKVWLPRGRKHLEPGVYDLKVSNGDDHQSTLLGSFCVVAASPLPLPANGQQVVSDADLGEVVAQLANSESILKLSSRYCSVADLDIDLDALMGPEVMVRKILFPAHSRSSIDFLKTYSQWGSVAFYGLRSDTIGTSNQACITLGRVPYTQVPGLRSRLGRNTVKSDFYQAKGEFCQVDSIEIHLPYRLSDGGNLRLLRYDDSSRSFQSISATADTASGVMIATGVQPGIFVVVE